MNNPNTAYASTATAAVSALGSISAALPMATSHNANTRTPVSGAGSPAVDSDACAM